jgi:hypothetical protein
MHLLKYSGKSVKGCGGREKAGWLIKNTNLLLNLKSSKRSQSLRILLTIKKSPKRDRCERDKLGHVLIDRGGDVSI